jgi:hypothetical protein
VPRFTRPSIRDLVERIGGDTHGLAERLDSETVVLRPLRGQRAELVANPGPEEEIEKVEPDADGRYAIDAPALDRGSRSGPANRPGPARNATTHQRVHAERARRPRRKRTLRGGLHESLRDR